MEKIDGCKMCEMGLPHVLTLSAPNAVRLEVHAKGEWLVVECFPENAITTGFSILDSARKAIEKDGKKPPERLIEALALLKGMAGS